MDKASRLKAIASSSIFTTCNCCGFVYLPMNKNTVNNCPICQGQITDEDDDYIKSEQIIYEDVNSEDFFLDYPKRVY